MRAHCVRLALVILVLPSCVAWQSAAANPTAEAERARREFQRQQRVIACQNRVLARQHAYPSAAEFLRAREACSATR